jgi:hypothetical protein
MRKLNGWAFMYSLWPLGEEWRRLALVAGAAAPMIGGQ